MTTELTQHPAPDEDVWREIENLVQEIAGFSRSDMSPSDFYQAVLSRTVTALAAVGGASWLCDAAGRFHLEFQIGLDGTGLVHDETTRLEHGRLLATVIRDGEARAIAPRSGRQGNHDFENPSEYLLMACPLVEGGRPLGVLEIFQRPTIHPSASIGHLDVLATIGELAVDFHRARLLRELRERETHGEQLRRFSQMVHRDLGLPETAYAVANEGRLLLGCDRLAVAVRRRRGCQLLAVSGVDSVDRRANLVRLLEQLTDRVLAVGDPLWLEGATSGLPPEIEHCANAYIDGQSPRSLMIVPLRDRGPSHKQADNQLGRTVLGDTVNVDGSALGALVIEQFDSVLDRNHLSQLDDVCQHASLALRNAIQLETLPLRSVSRALRRFTDRVQNQPAWRWTIAFAIGLSALAVMVIPADFEMKVRGQLRPLERRQIFAPGDGVVAGVNVSHDQPVEAGDVLVVLYNRELLLKRQEVRGQLQQTQQRLETVSAEKLQMSRDQSRDSSTINRLTAQESELEEAVRNFGAQLALVSRQIDDLTISSPMKGHVLTWQLEERLFGRPVRMGQSLMTVANVDGPWTLELQVPDHQLGHVLRVRRGLRETLPVSFMVATEPGVRHRGTLGDVARSVELDDQDHPQATARVNFDRDHIALLRPGTSVAARIHCGRRPLILVWLNGLLEAIRTRLLF